MNQEYYKEKFDALLDKCVVPNGSGHKCFSFAMLTDEDIRWIVDNCPDWSWLDREDDGGNNLYNIAVEKGFIREPERSYRINHVIKYETPDGLIVTKKLRSNEDSRAYKEDLKKRGCKILVSSPILVD